MSRFDREFPVQKVRTRTRLGPGDYADEPYSSTTRGVVKEGRRMVNEYVYFPFFNLLPWRKEDVSEPGTFPSLLDSGSSWWVHGQPGWAVVDVPRFQRIVGPLRTPSPLLSSRQPPGPPTEGGLAGEWTFSGVILRLPVGAVVRPDVEGPRRTRR